MHGRNTPGWALFIITMVFTAVACDASVELQPTFIIPPTVPAFKAQVIGNFPDIDQRTTFAQDSFDSSFDGGPFLHRNQLLVRPGLRVGRWWHR